MNKFFQLGTLKVSFSHKFEIGHQTSKVKVTKDGTKGGITKAVGIPKSTTVVIETSDGQKAHATSICSRLDEFNYEKGRKVALAKTLKLVNVPKEERRRMWDEYNKLKPGGRW